MGSRLHTMSLLMGLSLAVDLNPRVVWAGQLREKWSGTIEWCESIPSFLIRYHKINSTATGEFLEWTQWYSVGTRTITARLNGGDYAIDMWGDINLNTTYDSSAQMWNQPTAPPVTCSWILQMNGSVALAESEGTLTVNLNDDCTYELKLEGSEGKDSLQMNMRDASGTPAACGLASFTESVAPIRFPGDPSALHSSTGDPDNLTGTEKPSYREDTPAWYSKAIEELLNTEMPAVQAASLRFADPGLPGSYTSANWNVHRSKGQWAGDIGYKRTYNFGLTNSLPYGTGTKTTITTQKQTSNLQILMFGENEITGSLDNSLETQAIETTRADEECDDHTRAAFNVDADDAQTALLKSVLSHGLSVKIDTETLAGQHKATITVGKTPSISQRTFYTHDKTTYHGCTGESTTEHNSIFADLDFWLEATKWIADVQCQKIKGSKTKQNGPLTETWDWDLKYTHEGGASTVTSFETETARRPLVIEAMAQPLLLVNGIIECSFTNRLSLTNVVPEGKPQAGTVFISEGTIEYAAELNSSSGGAFAAMVQARQSSTHRADGTQWMICSETDGTTETRITNSIPASLQLTQTSSLSNTLTAEVSAKIEGDEYRVHVEIPEAKKGHSDTVWHVRSQPGCESIPQETEHRCSSETWGIGRRILEFHGYLSDTDPTRLAGQTQFDDGWIRWNLRTSASPVLELTINRKDADGRLVVSWRQASGVRLQQSMSLALPSWQDVPNTEATNSAIVFPTNKTTFFRLKKS
jgi:hypothetical protein